MAQTEGLFVDFQRRLESTGGDHHHVDLP